MNPQTLSADGQSCFICSPMYTPSSFPSYFEAHFKYHFIHKDFSVWL